MPSPKPLPKAADAVPGHNQPPNWAKIVTDAMALQYADLLTTAASLLADAKKLPTEVTTPKDSETVSASVVMMRKRMEEAEKSRVAEKREYLEKERAVDGFFNSIIARLEKGSDILHARVHNYNEKRRIAEETKRRQEFEAAQATERAAAHKLVEERRLADEAAAAASRARKPENIDAHKQVAEQHTDNAESARVDTLMATAAADEARIATMQKPAEMVRERFDSGIINTMAQVGYVEVLDRDKLDMNKLRPYFKEAEILRAVTMYAKATGHKTPMAGAIIEMRADTVIR